MRVSIVIIVIVEWSYLRWGSALGPAFPGGFTFFSTKESKQRKCPA